MMREFEYTSAEKVVLWALAIVGFIGLNGAFLYGALVRPEALGQSLRNPVAAAFILEALVLAFVLGWFLERWGVSRIGWVWFVVLSLVGSIAFAFPVALLWRRSSRSLGLGDDVGADGRTDPPGNSPATSPPARG